MMHSARAATGVAATLPAHLRDVRRVRDATAATVGNDDEEEEQFPEEEDIDADDGGGGRGNARVGGTNGSIVT